MNRPSPANEWSRMVPSGTATTGSAAEGCPHKVTLAASGFTGDRLWGDDQLFVTPAVRIMGITDGYHRLGGSIPECPLERNPPPLPERLALGGSDARRGPFDAVVRAPVAEDKLFIRV